MLVFLSLFFIGCAIFIVNPVMRSFLISEFRGACVFSRDEKKPNGMRWHYASEKL